MKKLLLIFILYAIPSHSQVFEEWVQRYNGTRNSHDYSTSMELDTYGNIYVTGKSVGSGSGFGYDIVTIKYNSSGNQEWVQIYNGTGNADDEGNSIAIDSLGFVYVTGRSMGIGTDFDFVTIKYTSQGLLEWVKRYNGLGNSIDEAVDVVVDLNENVYVTGFSKGISSNYDYKTIKYNSDGIEQWIQEYNGSGNNEDKAYSIDVDEFSNVYITGYSIGNISTYDFVTIKYNSNGTQQWLQRFNGTISGYDVAHSLKVDGLGNVYVTGISAGNNTSMDFATVKYNSSGIQQWNRFYNGIGNGWDEALAIDLDNFGNIFITGRSERIGNSNNYDYATIKYNSLGIQQWIQIYNGPNNETDVAYSICVDSQGNSYVTGWSAGIFPNSLDYTTIKYNTLGIQQWIQIYNGTGSGDDLARAVKVDRIGNVFVTGWSIDESNGNDYTTVKYSQQQFLITQPIPYAKWISGETSTISWDPLPWANVNIKCLLNFGTSSQTEIPIASNISVTQTEYQWLIPDNTLSYKSKIVIENAANPTQKIESDIFRIKPYLLTRVNPDSTYYEYRKNRDQWGFWNDSSQMFPQSWYQQFDYQGIDPFTGISYPQWQGFGAFQLAESKNFEDWISWVNTFTITECYWNTTLGIYKLWKVLIWSINKKKKWDGSCFGLAVSNGLVFRNKTEFLNKYPSYPDFSTPINVTSTNEVKKVINELFTHQFGQPHLDYRSIIGYNKTPTQTLIEMKAMLLSEKDSIRALTFYKNSQRSSGHTVLPYQIKQSTNNTNIYFVYIYDNTNPFSNNPITINTSYNGGIGYWSTPDWSGWDGTKNFFLEDPVQTYLSNPTDSKLENNDNGINTVQFLNSQNYSYKIKDMAGNISGYMNDSIENNILNSYPLIYLNASEGSPYGFQLPNANYRVEINGFSEDTIQAAFFLNNKAFSYERYNAALLETDKINFENGMSVSNPDPNIKNISLLNIQDETTQEKLFAFSSLELAQNDSVKIENLGSDNFKLTSYGTRKSYEIELNFASQSQIGRFVNVNIALPPNSSHTFVPNWINVSTSQLVILQDSGNNGTIEDTIIVNNIISSLEEGSLILPDKYSLAQNYPNPFNPSTKIKYDIKIDGLVTLKVYNILGMEVASLVNEVKQAGRYEVEFNGSNLGSGIFYYRLQAGDFIETKRMLLLK